MLTPAEYDQLLAGYALHMELTERGVACGIDSHPDKAPCLRVGGMTSLEVAPTADAHFDIWEVGEPLAPIACYLSLDEAVALLTAEHRA
jgi:hypothetical protein